MANTKAQADADSIDQNNEIIILKEQLQVMISTCLTLHLLSLPVCQSVRLTACKYVYLSISLSNLPV